MSTRYRLDLWSAPAPAGGTRQAFLVEGGFRAALEVERTRHLEPGRSGLSFTVLPDFHALDALVPGAGVVRFTRGSLIEEYRVLRRERVVRRQVGVYAIQCVPLEEDLLDVDIYRSVSAGGVVQFRYGATDRTPADVLQDLVDWLADRGFSWFTVGTVDPTTAVTFELERPTPRAVVDGLVAALAAAGVTAEFQLRLLPDLSAYALDLLDRIGGDLPALEARTDLTALDVRFHEDAAEQANVVVPVAEFAGLEDLVVQVAAVDGGTGWVTLEALGGTAAPVVAFDDQFNGFRLFRERTGRSFAILDSSALPMRVQLATADLASGLGVAERVSFRRADALTGDRRAYLTPARYSPAEVVSTATSPSRITTRNLDGGTDYLAAANQYRDWTVERSQLVAVLPSADFNHNAGTLVLASAPSANPAPGDWCWFPLGGKRVPLQVTSYDSGTRTVTGIPRYRGHQFTESRNGITGVRCYRPVGTPMWIQASVVTGNELQVDALTGPSFANTDVLEFVLRSQAERLVELTAPAAIAATRRRAGVVEVAAVGLTNRVPNGDQAAWGGGSGDPPDGYALVDTSGTIASTRVTDALLTRYGGKAWQLAFAAGAAGEALSPPFDVHPTFGADQVAAAVALRFAKFSGASPVTVTVYAVTDAGVRRALGEPVRIYPPDTALAVAPEYKSPLEAWYDAVLTNVSIADLQAERLRIGIRRTAGPACTLVWDAAMLLHHVGVPEHAEGGVRYLFPGDATRVLAAAQEALLDRGEPLVRFEGRFLDLQRLDGTRFPAHTLTPGRDVALTLVPLALTRTVRLLGVRESPDDPRQTAVVLDRVRPDVSRVLAAMLAEGPPVVDEVAPLDPLTPSLDVRWSIGESSVVIEYAGGPIIEYTEDQGYSWQAAPASPITVARPLYYDDSRGLRARTGSRIVFGPTIPIPRVPPIVAGEPTITGVTVSNEYTPCDGGGSFDFDLSALDMPGSVEYDWLAEVLDGYANAPTTDSDTGVAPGSLPATATLDLCPGARVRLTITAKDGGTPLTDFQTTVTMP